MTKNGFSEGLESQSSIKLAFLIWRKDGRFMEWVLFRWPKKKCVEEGGGKKHEKCMRIKLQFLRFLRQEIVTVVEMLIFSHEI